MNTEMDVEAIVYKHMAPFFKELERRLESLLPSQVRTDAKSPQKEDDVKSLVNLAKMLLALQERVHSLEMKDHYKEPDQQSVADCERSQSLNALSQKPTPADLDAEIAKAFMHWLRTPEDDARTPNFPDVQSKFRFLAFKAGVKFGQSKPLPNQTL